MYKRLTIAYATLCRETTPLLMSWAMDADSERYEEEQAMLALFNALQPAFEDFCMYKQSLHGDIEDKTNRIYLGTNKVTKEYDELFQNLILTALKTDKRPEKRRKVEMGVVMEVYNQ